MFKKIVFAFAVLALVMAFAGTVPPAGHTYKVTLLQASVVKGNNFLAGEYRITVGVDKVTIVNGKTPVEIPAKIENEDKKFDTTAIQYSTVNGKAEISEIRIGGTKICLSFK
jgi:hypothetical protein